LKELEKESLKPDFWQDSENAAKIQQEISEIKNEIEDLEKLKTGLEELKILQDGELEEELEEKIQKQEFKAFLSGKYDKGNAILEIFSGAGGQDSQDWATMLLRMYERYCTLKGFETTILHQTFGEAGGPEGRIGTKSVTVAIKGNYVYGFLKKES
jgi:peptide chain release factor 2